MADTHARLSELMQVRRLELGMKTWRALAAAADISPETLRALRAGENVAPGTADAIEKALRWGRGSIDRILDGGEPTRQVTGSASLAASASVTASGRVTEGAESPIEAQMLREINERLKADPELARMFLEILRRRGRPPESGEDEDQQRDTG